MSLLLDTCTLIWVVVEPDRIPQSTRDAIESEFSIYLSAVSGIEIANKAKTGKLRLSLSPTAWFDKARADFSLVEIPITLDHSIAAGALPLHHRDPFDRLLIAQARAEKLTLVTPDPVFARYDVALLW
ncbi:MAG: type II toxin-antitoxin system VapC family toxin [Rhodospirillaceae bacterium]|nr:type II toxin-antitoxin system VapC family toxin [Rhodospirillaceae bacterium]